MSSLAPRTFICFINQILFFYLMLRVVFFDLSGNTDDRYSYNLQKIPSPLFPGSSRTWRSGKFSNQPKLSESFGAREPQEGKICACVVLLECFCQAKQQFLSLICINCCLNVAGPSKLLPTLLMLTSSEAWRLYTAEMPGLALRTPWAISTHQALLATASSVPAGSCKAEHSGTLQSSQSSQGGQAARLGCPLALLTFVFCAPQGVFLFSLIKYTPLKYNNSYEYPPWGYVLGWLMALSSMVCIPLYAIFILLKTKGPLKQVLGLWSLWVCCCCYPRWFRMGPSKDVRGTFLLWEGKGWWESTFPRIFCSCCGNLESLEGLSTTPRLIIKCPVFCVVLYHNAQCNI